MKNVTLHGQEFQLRKMLPVTGSFIFMKLMGTLLEARQQQEGAPRSGELDPAAPAPSKEDRARMLVTIASMTSLTYEQTVFIHGEALKVVSRLEDGKPMPLVDTTGRWFIKSVEDDPALVQELVVESVVFNVTPFFA